MSPQVRKNISKYEFYSMLMLAVAELRRDFLAEGPAFHRAFSKAVEFALANAEYAVEDAVAMRVDPVFGVVHQATEMLLEAEEDRLISLLNPELRTAQFKISEQQAASELEALGHAAWFRELAQRFVNELPA